jgi:AAA+ superfamily predicted ATPase
MLRGINEPMLNTMNLAARFLKLNPEIDMTGGMAKDDYIQFKKRLMPDYDFKIVDDCPLIGNARLALRNK